MWTVTSGPPTFAAKTPQRNNTHEMLPYWTLSQVRRARKLVYALFYFGMLTSAAFAFPANLSPPRITHAPNRSVVIFDTPPCQPLSREHLQMQLGAAFDPRKMALDDDGIKRSLGDKQSFDSLLDEERNEDEIDSLFQSDYDDDSPDPVQEFLEATTKRLPEKTVQVQDSLVDHHSRYNSRNFMRRRRDTRSLKKDSANYLFQRLIKNGVLPKRLKRKEKKSRKNMPWVCKMKTIWKKMEDGYFPPYIQTGYCKSSSCMYSMYECIPKLYEIKILKRDPNRCNPVPSYGVNTTYEEKWYFDVKEVTVCCECGKRKRSKKRRPRKGH